MNEKIRQYQNTRLFYTKHPVRVDIKVDDVRGVKWTMLKVDDVKVDDVAI